MHKRNYITALILAIGLLFCHSCDDGTLENVEMCNNGIDDDGDGDIDCDDNNCDAASVCNPVEICDNGIDDDGDGNIDCVDSECDEFMGCFEVCDNGIDDDGNGLVDCLDSACTNLSESLFVGKFIGRYGFIGVSFAQEDTLTIGYGANATDLVLEIESTQMQTTFSGTVNSCNSIEIENDLIIDSFIVSDTDTFYTISIGDSSSITLSNDVQTLWLKLDNTSIADGTVDLSQLGTDYPITNLTIESDSEGSIRQQ